MSIIAGACEVTHVCNIKETSHWRQGTCNACRVIGHCCDEYNKCHQDDAAAYAGTATTASSAAFMNGIHNLNYVQCAYAPIPHLR